MHDDTNAMARLLVVTHSRTGGTAQLADAFVRGTTTDGIDGIEVDRRVAEAADAAAVRAAAGIAIVTPERFGSMAGLVKDFFERIYYEVLDDTIGRPYVLVVKGGVDGLGTVEAIAKVAAGLRWRRVLEPVVVVDEPTADQLQTINDLGATFAAGLAERIF